MGKIIKKGEMNVLEASYALVMLGTLDAVHVVHR